MNQFHKLPHKERKRQAEYRFNITEKQEKTAIKREMKQLEKEKCSVTTDKERQEEEAFLRLMEVVGKTEGNNG